MFNISKNDIFFNEKQMSFTELKKDSLSASCKLNFSTYHKKTIIIKLNKNGADVHIIHSFKKTRLRYE